MMNYSNGFTALVQEVNFQVRSTLDAQLIRKLLTDMNNS